MFIWEYFQGMLGPQRAIAKKERFSYGQIFVLAFFLLALLLTPFAFEAGHKQVELEAYFPHLSQMLTKESEQKIQQLHLKEGEKIGPQFQVQTKAGQVQSIATTTKDQLKKVKNENALILASDGFILADQNGKTMVVAYPKQNEALPKTKTALLAWIQKYWFMQNQMALKLLFLWTAFTVVASLFVLVLLGASLITYFFLKRQKSASIKASLTLVLLAAGLPTIGTSIAACLFHDAMLGLQIQMATWVLMLSFILCHLAVPGICLGREMKNVLWKGNS